MFCKNCGRKLNQGEIFCADCGTRVGQPVNNNVYPNQQVINTNMQVPSKKNSGSKVLIIVLIAIGLIVAGVVAFFVLVFKNLTADANKLVCKSNEGNITIMYKNDEIIGYTVVNMEYDLDEQKEYAKEIGIDAYILEFKEWFSSHTTGSCVVEGEDYEEIEENEEIVEEEPEVEVSNTKTVGNDDYGYITIPNNWVKFTDIDGNDSIQYSYAGSYIVSLNRIDANGYTAKDYASNYMYNKQNDTSVTGVTGATVTVGKNKEYTGYQVYMYYPTESIYLITYWFDTNDGKVRYIALEGPETLNDVEIYDFLTIPESFSLNKSI